MAADPDVRWFTKADEPGAPVVGDYVVVSLCDPDDDDDARWEEPGIVTDVSKSSGNEALKGRLIVATSGMEFAARYVRHRDAPESLQLKDPYGQPVAVWVCGACKGWAHGSESSADSCCRPVKCSCGAGMERGYAKCTTCSSAERGARDARRFELAAQVFIEDYRGEMVCVEDADELVMLDYLPEWLEEERLKHGVDYTPPRVYAASPTQHYLDGECAIENALDDAFEGADEHVDCEAKAELDTYLREWSEVHLPETHYADYALALVPWPVMYSAETCARLLDVKRVQVLKTMVHLGFVPKACDGSQHLSLVGGRVHVDGDVLALIRRELKSRGDLAKPRENG